MKKKTKDWLKEKLINYLEENNVTIDTGRYTMSYKIGIVERPYYYKEHSSEKLEEMINLGITKATANKIIEYREEVGVVRRIEELGNIKGIGDKRLEKLKLILSVNENNLGSQKKININDISSNKLAYYGFSKEEIKKIDKWKAEKGSIFSSVDLIEIIGEKRYDEIKSMITY